MSTGAFIFLIILSYIVSFTLLTIGKIDEAKTLADLGYILDEIKYNEYDKNNSDENDGFKLLLLMVPFFNFMVSIIETYDYIINKNIIINELITFDCVREMTAEEIKEYNKNRKYSVIFKASIKDRMKARQENSTKQESFSSGVKYLLFNKAISECIGTEEKPFTCKYYATTNFCFENEVLLGFNDHSKNGEIILEFKNVESPINKEATLIVIKTLLKNIEKDSNFNFDISLLLKHKQDCTAFDLEFAYNRLQELTVKADKKTDHEVFDELTPCILDNILFISYFENDQFISHMVLADVFFEELKKLNINIEEIDDLSFKGITKYLFYNNKKDITVSFTNDKEITYNNPFPEEKKDGPKVKKIEKPRI